MDKIQLAPEWISIAEIDLNSAIENLTDIEQALNNSAEIRRFVINKLPY